MRVISLTGATSVLDPVHGEHHAGPDGVFDLPQQFADHLLKTAAGSFRGEADHLARQAQEAFDQLRDPRVALQMLSDLLGRMTALEARVAELEAPEEPEDGAVETESGTEPESKIEDVGTDDEVEEVEDADGSEPSEEPEDDEPELKEAIEPEEAPKPTTNRRPGTDRPPRVRPAPKSKA